MVGGRLVTRSHEQLKSAHGDENMNGPCNTSPMFIFQARKKNQKCQFGNSQRAHVIENLKENGILVEPLGDIFEANGQDRITYAWVIDFSQKN